MKKSVLLFSVVVMMAFMVVSAHAQTVVKFGGYLQTWMLSQQSGRVASHPGVDSMVSGFRIRRARLSAKAELNEIFSVETWLEFASASNILLDYKGTAKIVPQFAVSIGQFIPPVSMNETANQASSKLPFYEISDIGVRLVDLMGTNAYRDIGMMVGGNFEIQNAGNLKYGVFYGNGRGRFNSVGAGQSVVDRKFGQGLYGARLDYEPMKGWFIGGHYSTNKQDSIYTGTAVLSLNRNSYSFNVGVDGLAALPELFVDVEYGNGKVRDLSETEKVPFDFNGFYGTVGYKVLPDLQFLVRYDGYTQNNLAFGTRLASTTKATNWTFGGTYYFFKEKVELVKVGLNYEVRNEDPVNARNNIFVLWVQFKM